MLPPRLAALRFADAALGSDDALAARTAATVPGARVLLFGASRPGLTDALLGAGLDVVVVDSSRTALRRARDTMRDPGRVLLLAADPRELEVPGGVDAVLVPSAVWRAVILSPDRRHVLRGISHELRPGGLLLLDLERVPAPPPAPLPLPGAPEGVLWRGDELGAVVEDAGLHVTFATFSPEEAVAEALDEGFADPDLRDAGTGDPAGSATAVVWARLRTVRGSA